MSVSPPVDLIDTDPTTSSGGDPDETHIICCLDDDATLCGVIDASPVIEGEWGWGDIDCSLCVMICQTYPTHCPSGKVCPSD